MRKIWVKADPWDKDLVLTALESGADGIMVPDGCSEKVKELGRIATICADGDLVPGKDVEFFTITSGEDEEAICRLAAQKLVVLECTDWTIIPLENLIAKGADVAALVRSFDEAQLAFGILEKGVKQVMLDTRDEMELKKTLDLLKGESATLPLVEAEIIEVKNIGMGDRVCVDTCQSMATGQGMLVGNSSSALFLVHAETVSNPYVAPRPFRVNAGAVHAYTRVPGGRTRYLSEIKAGDEVEIVNHEGAVSSAVVGRIKIEKRPMLLITARIGEKGVATIVQNAETIRLTSPAGEPLSVVSLSPGDRVMAFHEEGGRHFGHKVDETITEK
jgi:3-dehydroquinate synthase II